MERRQYGTIFIIRLCLFVIIGLRLSVRAERFVQEELGVRDSVTSAADPCVLRISHDLGNHQPPLLLYAGTLQTLRSRTDDARGTITLPAGQGVRVLCTGRHNHLRNVTGENTTDMTVYCAGGSKFTTADGLQTVAMRRLECARWPERETRPAGTCQWGKLRLRTGFPLPEEQFVPVYESCFDGAAGRTVYTKFALTSDATGAQHGVKRPSWHGREHFHAADPNAVYQKTAQRRIFAALLGSEELAERYVRFDGDRHLSRGHLAAKADFLLGAAQSATFHYANAAPQWQSFNGNNWNALENDVREFVGRLRRDVWCYTGTVGVATLRDADGVEAELFLGANRTLAVPAAYWKVLYDEVDGRGVAFVGLNNPHRTAEEAASEVRCRDICERLVGMRLTWRQMDVRRGYSYCCEVNDFRASFPDVLPDFAVVGILGTESG